MAQVPEKRLSAWLAFVAGGLVAAAVIFGVMTWQGARNLVPKALSVHLELPGAPRLPETPGLPPPPIPTPR